MYAFVRLGKIFGAALGHYSAPLFSFYLVPCTPGVVATMSQRSPWTCLSCLCTGIGSQKPWDLQQGSDCLGGAPEGAFHLSPLCGLHWVGYLLALIFGCSQGYWGPIRTLSGFVCVWTLASAHALCLPTNSVQIFQVGVKLHTLGSSPRLAFI